MVKTASETLKEKEEKVEDNAYDDGSKEYKDFLKGAIREPEKKKREDGTMYDEEKKRWMVLINVEKWVPKENYLKFKGMKREFIGIVDELCKGKEVERVIFQLEAGEVDRLGHIHFYVELAKARDVKYVKEKFKEWFGYAIAPPQIVLPKKELGVIKYVKKETTRIMGSYYDSMDDYATSDDVEKYRDCQELILKRIEEVDGNEILFVIDEGGGIGKSTLALREADLTEMGSMEARRHTVYLHDDFKSVTDCYKYLSSMFLNAMSLGVGLKYEAPTVFVDCTRMTKISPYDLAGLLERIKNGACYDDRYGSKFKKVKSPKVCVFSNKDIPGITHRKGKIEVIVLSKGVKESMIVERKIENCLLTESRLRVLKFSKEQYKRKKIQGVYEFVRHDGEGNLKVTKVVKGHDNMYMGK